MNMRLRALAGGLLLATLLAGCSRQAPPAPAPEPRPAAGTPAKSAGKLPAGIDWFPGEVDAAFAAARAGHKPLFLYWGAEWCPPCAQIKATIFNRREFQERSRLFVPVYLDGDTPSAQKYGEKFGVVGYPTMILFRADGAEITRLPGGVDIARYAKILDVALAAAHPVSEILAAARSGGEVRPDDWRLLAYYSWSSDNGRVLPAADRVATFRALGERCPVELAADCSRFFFEYLSAVAGTGKDGKPALNGLERADARRKLLDLLPKPPVQQANVENLLYAATDDIGALSDAGSTERTQLTTAWRRALDELAALAGPGALSTKEQLNLLRARVLLAKLDAPDAPLPPALLEQARKSVADVDARVTDSAERQAVINAAVRLYWDAGLDAEASRLLTAELGRSKSPYYFMLDLADLAKKAGRKQEAVQWLARAYHDSHGTATRFQWGYDYLVGMLEMTPEDVRGIERAGLEVLGELDGTPDAFYQRTRTRLEQLSSRLLEWGHAGERAAVVGKLRARTQEICAKLPEGDEGRAACESFLKRG
jgi:thiol-disulfide isomerase/thioredoxin